MRLVQDRGFRSTARSRQETWEARFIVAATFPFFLCGAVAARLLPGLRAGGGLRATIGEARTAASACAAFAFMG